MYVETLTVRNLRCFEDVVLNLVCPGQDERPIANVTLVLGDNGAGKTTLLRAIAMASLGEVLLQSGFVPYRLIRRAGGAFEQEARGEAGVALHLEADERAGKRQVSRLHTTLERRGDFDAIRHVTQRGKALEASLYDEFSPAFFLVGYGSTRRVESSDRVDLAAREKARLFRYQRVATLFEEQVSLMPLAAWLPRVQESQPERFAEVLELLNDLLGEQARMTGAREGADYMFEVSGVAAPFPALSDGYRAYIGWVGDLLYHMCRACPPQRPLRRMRGVVLVDEIDLHLHPDWQRTVVPSISATLPELQFVFTTHSALVAGTLHAENIRVVATEPGRASRVKRLQERVHGLGVDQILLGGYFNLPSTRAPEVGERLLELSRRARGGDEEAALAALRTLAQGVEDADANEAPPRARKARKTSVGATRRSAKKGAKKAAGRKAG